MSILHKSETDKQLKPPQILKSIFPSVVLLFYLFLEDTTPTVTA